MEATVPTRLRAGLGSTYHLSEWSTKSKEGLKLCEGPRTVTGYVF